MNRHTIGLKSGGKVMIDTTHMKKADTDRLVEAIEYTLAGLDQDGEGGDPNSFHVTSNYGHRTQLPFVGITVGAKNFMAQLSPDNARSLASNLFTAAEAADSDAMLMHYLTRKIGIDDVDKLGAILLDFRNIRQEIAELSKQAEEDDPTT